MTGSATERRAQGGSDAAPDDAHRSLRTVLVVLFVVDVAYAFQQTAVIPAIPTVQQDLGASQQWSAWLLSAYLMVAVVATPAIGRLADLYGRRRLMLISLALFTAGSVLAALAPGLGVLLTARAIQGVGGAVFPLTFAVVREVAPPEKVSNGIATLTGAFGAGTALGFAAGGVLADGLSWRWVFGVGAVATGLAAVLLGWGIPAGNGSGRGRFDTVGALLLSLGSVSWILWLTLGPQLGFLAWPTLAALAAAVAGTVGWIRWERRHPDPLVDLSVFRLPAVRWSNVASIGLGWGLFGGYFLLPELLRARPAESGFGFDAGAAMTGVLLLPAAVGQTVAGPLAGRLSARTSPRAVLAGGLLLLTAALAALTQVQDSVPALMCWVTVLGLGAGLGVQAAGAVTTEQVDPEIAALSSSVNSTVRRFAGGVGGQFAALLLAEVATGGHPAHSAYVVAFAVAAGVALLGAAACWRIPPA